MSKIRPNKISKFNKKLYEPGWFTERVIRKYLQLAVPYLKGRLLDAGCGRQPYKHILLCNEYVGMEISDKFRPDIVGDIKDMSIIGSNEFDSLLSSQVIEHVDDIDLVFSEFQRILKPGGYLCLTFPFIARLHGSPYDYWRFSENGIKFLFNKYGFETVLIAPMGGFLTTQCYLWNYFIYENLAKYKVTRVLSKLLFIFLNPIFLFVHNHDKDRTTPHNYLSIAKKLKI